MSILYSGAATAIFSAVAIPSSMLLSHYSDKFGRKAVALIILPLASLSIFFMATSSSLTEALLSIAFYGVVGKLSLDSLVIAWVSVLTDENQAGNALALVNFAAMSSSILAPVITGVLADLTGTLDVGFYFGSAIVMLGLILLL